MVDGQRREWWNHTASQVAAIFEVNRNPKARKQPFQPIEFHPTSKDKDANESKVSGIRGGTPEWKALGEHFTRSKKKRKRRKG